LPPLTAFVRSGRAALVFAVLASAITLHVPVRAQSLSFSLFDRYLDSLREQANIPALSGLISQHGNIVWERSLGRQNLEASTATTFETTYAIGGLSQTIGATLLLQKCVDEGSARVSDRVVRWDSRYPEPNTTLQALLTHTSPGGSFAYSPARFAALTAVVEQCVTARYGPVAEDAIFRRLGMTSTVPGHALVAPTASDRSAYDAATLNRYADALRRLAVPYRIDSRGRAVRSEITPAAGDAAAGIVSTARDLHRFDAALRTLLEPATLADAWTRKTSGTTPLPTGLGWFVQNYRGELIVWQFGVVPNAYSSLMIKAPNRGITLILLANSDGLSAPFGLDNGDVTTSVFAQLFLQLLVP
jgi:CubicO group peptidase (beta-lactamase class C family)